MHSCTYQVSPRSVTPLVNTFSIQYSHGLCPPSIILLDELNHLPNRSIAWLFKTIQYSILIWPRSPIYSMNSCTYQRGTRHLENMVQCTIRKLSMPLKCRIFNVKYLRQYLRKKSEFFLWVMIIISQILKTNFFNVKYIEFFKNIFENSHLKKKHMRG